jgi:uncharacterized membrane protein YdbT with pleckstrin-like domain
MKEKVKKILSFLWKLYLYPEKGDECRRMRIRFLITYVITVILLVLSAFSFVSFSKALIFIILWLIFYVMMWDKMFVHFFPWV